MKHLVTLRAGLVKYIELKSITPKELPKTLLDMTIYNKKYLGLRNMVFRNLWQVLIHFLSLYDSLSFATAFPDDIPVNEINYLKSNRDFYTKVTFELSKEFSSSKLFSIDMIY